MKNYKTIKAVNEAIAAGQLTREEGNSIIAELRAKRAANVTKTTSEPATETPVEVITDLVNTEKVAQECELPGRSLPVDLAGIITFFGSISQFKKAYSAYCAAGLKAEHIAAQKEWKTINKKHVAEKFDGLRTEWLEVDSFAKMTWKKLVDDAIRTGFRYTALIPECYQTAIEKFYPYIDDCNEPMTAVYRTELRKDGTAVRLVKTYERADLTNGRVLSILKATLKGIQSYVTAGYNDNDFATRRVHSGRVYGVFAAVVDDIYNDGRIKRGAEQKLDADYLSSLQAGLQSDTADFPTLAEYNRKVVAAAKAAKLINDVYGQLGK